MEPGKLAISGNSITYTNPVGETRPVSNQQYAQLLLTTLENLRNGQLEAREHSQALAMALSEKLLEQEREQDRLACLASQALTGQQDVILAQQKTIDRLVDQRSQTESQPRQSVNTTVVVEHWGYINHNAEALLVLVTIILCIVGLGGLSIAMGRQQQAPAQPVVITGGVQS